MKRIVSALLLVVMGILLLAGCGSEKNDATAEEKAAVEQTTEAVQNVDADEEEEETEETEAYVDPHLSVAVDGETLLGYVAEVEVTLDNWQEYFYTGERVDETGGEHAGKTFVICVNDGYVLNEDVVFEVAYNKKTNYTTTLPEYGPSTNVFDDYVEGAAVEVSSYSNTGFVTSTYIYDEADDGVVTELVIEVADFTCSSVSGKLYSMQIPEDMWQTEDSTQVLYLKMATDDGEEFAAGFENTQEGLLELWDVLRYEYM